MAVKTSYKIAAGFLLAAAIAAAGAAFIVHRLPDLDTYRTQILSIAQDTLHRRVTYRTATLSWQVTPSIVFRDISIAEKSGDTGFLEIERLSVKLALLPLLRKEVRFREVVVERPLLILSRDHKGVFNFHDLLAGQASGFEVRLNKVRINNALVRFTDRLYDPNGLTTTVEKLDVYVDRFVRGKSSAFKLSALIPGESGHAAVSISGTAGIPAAGESLNDARFAIKLSAKDLDGGRFWPYYARYLPSKPVRGVLDIEQEFKGTPLEFTTKGEFRIKGLRFDYPGVFHSVLTPGNLQCAYEVERTSRDLAVKSFDLNVDGLRVKGNCLLGDIRTKDPHISARVITSSFQLEKFRQYIPYGIIPKGTADFIAQRIKDGIFTLDDGRLDGRIQQILHMGHDDNSNALFIRARVEKGLLTMGPEVPTFNNIKGVLEMSGKDFNLRGLSGNFGTAPFTLEGKIADYPLATPARYPFTMTIAPGKPEVAWLFRLDKDSGADFSGQSLLRLSGSGSAADYRLAGTWELSRADYRIRQFLHKPAGMTNRLDFSAILGSSAAQLTDFRYTLPHFDLTGNAAYRYRDPVPLTFAAATSRFTLNANAPLLPGLQHYSPAGSLQVSVNGSGNPAVADSIRLKGDLTLADISVQPFAQIKPVSGITGKIHLTETALQTEQLTGRVGDSPFTVRGEVSGLSKPTVNLAFSSPRLHLEDFGYHAPGQVPVVENLAGNISLQGNSLTISSLSGQVARTKFALSGEVPDISAPNINLRVDFPYLRVEDLAPLAGLKRAAAGKEQPAGSAVKVRITSADGSYLEAPFRHLETEMLLQNDRLGIQALRFNVFGGTVAGSGQVDFLDAGGPTYQAHYRVERVDVAQLLQAAGEKAHLTGLLAATGELTGRGSSREALKNSGLVTAELLLTNGTILLPAPAATKSAGKVPFKKIQTRLSLTGNNLDMNSLLIEAFGGQISGEGKADFTNPDDPGYRLGFRLENIDAADFLRTLDASKDISGKLASQGEFTARGGSLLALEKSARGSLMVRLEKGTINKYGLIAKVFSIINITQLLDYRLPDMVSTGMPYNEILGNYTFNDGTVATSDLSIHSRSLNMTVVGTADIVNRELDVKIGVLPFQSVDRIVHRIPVIGWLMNGGRKNLVVFFYEAKGGWDEPTVSALPMDSLSGGVLNIFKRAFNLPEKMITEPGKVFLGD